MSAPLLNELRIFTEMSRSSNVLRRLKGRASYVYGERAHLPELLLKPLLSFFDRGHGCYPLIAVDAKGGNVTTTERERRGSLKAGSSESPPSVLKRGRGRPVSITKSVGPDTIVAMTCELLSILPPSKVTRASVARRAGVDDSLIGYYFQSRSNLLVAAAEKMMDDFGGLSKLPRSSDQESTAARLQTRMGALLKLVVSHPFFHRLITQELLLSDAPAAKRLIERMTNRGVSAYDFMLREGEAEGLLRRVEPAYLFITVIGMCEAFVSLSPLLDIALGKTCDPKGRQANFEEFMWDILFNGLSASTRNKRASKRKNTRAR